MNMPHIAIWMRRPQDPPEMSIKLQPWTIAVSGGSSHPRLFTVEMQTNDTTSLHRFNEPGVEIFFGYESTIPGRERRRLYFFKVLSISYDPLELVDVAIGFSLRMELEEIAPYQDFPCQ